tara:strand:+ start:1776 stop:2543 length:768 start_codon:yes stop_codon:yes gene_type:complete
MLKTRIIPSLLYKDFGLVKGIKFDSWRRIGPVLPAVKVYNMREVDELFFLDITATNKRVDPDYDSIKELSKFCFVPLTVGGGINKIDQVDKLLEIGADKVCINTAAYENSNLIKEIADKYGSQSIVVSIDVRYTNREWTCFGNSGSINMNIDPFKWAKHVESMGAGEILLTSIDRDGTMSGFDQELIANISNLIKIPLVASGGAGSFDDMYLAISSSGASALSVSSIFHFTEKTPLEVKTFLDNKSIPVRKNFFC